MNNFFWIDITKKWSVYINKDDQKEASKLAVEHVQKEKKVKSVYSMNLFDDEEWEDEY